MSDQPLRITVWNEFVHEQQHQQVRDIYPQGIHAAIVEGLTPLFGESEQQGSYSQVSLSCKPERTSDGSYMATSR